MLNSFIPDKLQTNMFLSFLYMMLNISTLLHIILKYFQAGLYTRQNVTDHMMFRCHGQMLRKRAVGECHNNSFSTNHQLKHEIFHTEQVYTDEVVKNSCIIVFLPHGR